MRVPYLMLTAAAGILAGGITAAPAQQSPDGPMMQQPNQQMRQQLRERMQERMQERAQGAQASPSQAESDNDHDGGPGRRHEGRGMGPPGMMGGGPGLRIIFSLMDPDADGTVSLDEFKAAQERIFKAMDANKDGVVSFEEMQDFIRGGRRPPPRP